MKIQNPKSRTGSSGEIRNIRLLALAFVIHTSTFSLLFADPAPVTSAPFVANQSGTNGFVVNTGTSNGTLGASGTGMASLPLWNGSPIASVALQTNGTANSSQTVLDLVGDGTSVFLTDLGAGVIQFASSPAASLLDGLLAYWTLDETSGNRVDSSGNGYNLTDQGGTGSGAGVIGNCATFDGSSQYLYDNTTFPASATWTVCAWINTTIISGAVILCDPSGMGIILLINYGGASGIEVFTNGGSEYESSPLDVADGNWHYIAVTADSGNTVSFYADGIPCGTASLGGTNAGPWGSYLPMSVGEVYGSGLGIIGSIDELAVWNIALTRAQITELYQRGSGLPFSDF